MVKYLLRVKINNLSLFQIVNSVIINIIVKVAVICIKLTLFLFQQ